MRLNSIKLSGFKSFAEPTHFQLPGQLVGVVGPNGCGKSNIMDAVRWVLGESKASELRGESMQDVIFNGSGQRKPASRASVELVFGNEDSRAGGQWGQFAEIAVKRVLTRDGSSSYFINNQAVRRRDVQDVFLGTGLGPRAYAIIGQGTISRIIESKPEELRLFLEEAAGVSKYKERRRETEGRLKDTRENLTRVEDILRELHSNLDKLERQAEVAARYQSLQEEAQLALHRLWWLKYRDASQEQTRLQEAASQAQLALEAKLAELRQLEAQIESLRQLHYEASDATHQAQGAMGEASMEVSRLEERMRYLQQGQQRLRQQLGHTEQQLLQWSQRASAASQQLLACEEQQGRAQEQSQHLQARVDELAQGLPQMEDAVREASQAQRAQRLVVQDVQQAIHALAVESRGWGERQRQAEQRQERLHKERAAQEGPDERALQALDLERERAHARQQEAQERLDALLGQESQLDQSRGLAQQASQAQAQKLGALNARLQALMALQDKVQTEGKLLPWLQKHGLQGLAGLWHRLHIEPGWEPALEAVLRERLGALELSQLASVVAFEADAPAAKLAFYRLPQQSVSPPAPRAGMPALLVDMLSGVEVGLRALLGDWLEGVYVAADLAQAIGLQDQLRHGEVVVTPAGHMVSPYSVVFYAPDSPDAGLLARAQEIENLHKQVRAQSLLADEARSLATQADSALAQHAQELAQQRRQVAQLQQQAHDSEVQWTRQSQLAQHASSRRADIDRELQETHVSLDEAQARQQQTQAQLEALDESLAQAQERMLELEDRALEAERALSMGKEQVRQLERQAQEAAFELRSLLARQEELRRQIREAEEHQAQGAQSLSELQAQWQELQDTDLQAALDEALSQRVLKEQALSVARQHLDEVHTQLKRADEARLGIERGLEPMREGLTRWQLEAQAASLGGAQYLEQLQAAEVDTEALQAALPVGSTAAALQGQVDRLQRAISALGAVNLAALQELDEARQRKQFLDAQMTDLMDAMGTLESAIRKIDAETRELLGSTFETVNGHFGRMFPSLFGGGSAKLVMTGEEVLDAGVQVMAHPPGKKNSTIHLLSGGEKALTAIALVFAIFQLNPAPFCLLDEVDAPLDDANTERYAKLVKNMSEGTQFLFISHNKIAMEMAQQLVGVTMQEQGVSRIVAVDMQSALDMAQAA